MDIMGGKKITTQECHDYASKHNGILLSEAYENSGIPLKWKCGECGNEWGAIYKYMKNRNQWCRKCQYTNLSKNNKDQNGLQKAHNLAKSKGGLCLSTTHNNNRQKLEWQCKNGHNFTAPMMNVGRKKDPTWCPVCVGKVKHTIEECKEFAVIRGGVCLSDNYVNVKTHYTWKCQKDHEWEATFDHIIQGQWCPNCLYKTEQKCREMFETKYHPHKFSKSHPKFLKGLELDGYCKELNLAFEYDGEFHYMPHWARGEEGLVKQKERDTLKDDLCKEHGIQLIRIPYFDLNKLDSMLVNL